MNNISNRELITHGMVLAFSVMAGGILAVLFGKDLSFDVANYHYYIPFAFFNGRQSIDFWPTSYLHLFLNPAIDFLPYFLINHLSPRTMEFTLGAIHGTNFWLLFFIARTLISRQPRLVRDFIALFIAFVGMYGPTVYPGIGSVSNDNLVSIFVLSFVLLQIKSLRQFAQSTHFKPLIGGGVLLGIGVGLKLTTGIFLLGGAAAFLVLPVSIYDRAKLFCIFSASAAAGIILSSGYWMLLMWQQHHNPVFPFLNNIFHSPDFASANWRDIRFMPHGIWQQLFYPFYFSWNGLLVGDTFRDFRFMFVYILLLFAGLHWLWNYAASRRQPDRGLVTSAAALPVCWLVFFIIFSYIVWQCYISYGRYLAPLEMLAPLLIYLLLKSLFRRDYYGETVFIYLGLMMIIYMSPSELVRIPNYQSPSYFNVRFPSLVMDTPDALVLTPYPLFLSNKTYINHNPRPQTYLIPLLPARWRFIGVPLWDEKYHADAATDQSIKARVRLYHNRIFLLTPGPYMPLLYDVVKAFDLVPDGRCGEITSDRQSVTGENLLLCPVRLRS